MPRLLDAWVLKARKHGVASHAQTAWVRRKLGGHLLVWRTTADGHLACATPCIYCRREIVRYDVTIHCSQSSTAWYSGRLSSSAAPLPQLTSGQRRNLQLPRQTVKAQIAP